MDMELPSGRELVEALYAKKDAEIAVLREQNRVLRSNLVNCAARLEAYYGEDYPAVRDAKAALTATSQPAPPYKEWCRHPDKCAGLASCPQDPTCAD